MTSTISPNKFIIESPDWKTFFQSVSELDSTKTTVKGDIFDRLTQLYLQTSPIYKIKLKNVWLREEVPSIVKRKINFPDGDFGIDQVAETFDGEYWSIQSKFRSHTDSALTYGELSTFSTLSFVHCNDIKLGIVSHTSMLPIRNRKKLGNVSELGLEKWSTIDQEIWDAIRSLAKGKTKSLERRKKRKHQIVALKKVKDYFSNVENKRGKIIMPCGSGKSLIGFWAAETLDAKSVLIAVPSLHLIGQTIKDWAREFLAKGEIPDWLVVCDNKKIDELNKDEFVGEVYELGIDPSTKTENIKKFISKHSNKKKIIFSTYHSSKLIVEAATSVGFEFDLTICDEAHKTVGYREKPFAALVSDPRFNSKHRIFMTATEKVLKIRNDDVLSMDEDSNDYGKTIYFLSHGEAISSNPQIISDYRIVTLEISETRIKKMMEENEYLFEKGGEFEKAEAKDVGSCLALIDLFEKHSCRKGISFHSSIKRSEDFKKLSEKITELLGHSEIDHYTVSSKLPPGKRTSVLDDFDQSKKALITNARCLNEGVDLPAVDCIIFSDPKNSIVDIVQASGRALRLNKGKEFGFILIPLIVPENLDFEEFTKESNFRHIARTITALSIYDNRIVEQFRLLDNGMPGGGGVDPVIIEEVVQTGINISQFKASLYTKIWTNVGRANWRPFEEARAFVHNLGLKGLMEWTDYHKSSNRPADIPSGPAHIYKDKGWISMGDWLGTGYIATRDRIYKSFEEARAFVHNLGLKRQKEWLIYCKSIEKPEDIPANPDRTYKDEGWISMGDWLGTGRISNLNRQYKSFEEARAFVHNLGLKLQKEWLIYCKSIEKPKDIPANPEKVYKNDGYKDLPDWLGSGRPSTKNRKYKSFKEARAFVHNLALKNTKEWKDYYKSANRPDDITSVPNEFYKDKGWISMGDWIGTGAIATFNRKYRQFKKARAFIHNLDINNQKEWQLYIKSGEKPDDIPAKPEKVYKNDGYKDLGDWLGNGVISNRNRQYKSFKEARAFVHDLGLKNQDEWRDYISSGEKPPDITAKPERVYKNDGYKDLGDWLGTGRIGNRNRKYKSFKEARVFVHNLGIKNQKEWGDYYKSSNRPADIPSAPDIVYKDKGWISLGDWLGTGVVSHKERIYKSFKEAKIFVITLNLKTEAQWVEYAKSGKKPDDLPKAPMHVYKDKGWNGIKDWLGIDFKSFKNARKFAHSLGFDSRKQWDEFCKSGKKPDNIPGKPNRFYKNKGWLGIEDWLGYSRWNFRRFKEARAFVRGLGLNSVKEWYSYSSSGKRPKDIPSNPNKIYKDLGWKSEGDWVGISTRSKKENRNKEKRIK
jgi:superfamily II DNA or RNA helicase